MARLVITDNNGVALTYNLPKLSDFWHRVDPLQKEVHPELITNWDMILKDIQNYPGFGGAVDAS